MRRGAFLGAVSVALLVVGTRVPARDLPEGLPRIPFHLTARPWKPLDLPRERYLDAIEGVCRFTIRHQDKRGAVIDAFLGREHQYSTPYFAFAVGTLIHAGRARDLLDHGVAAMDHATECFARGGPGIPDAHGEFFLASLPVALELYAGHVPAGTIDRWRRRMGTPWGEVIKGGTNNWRTYAMKGEWLRARLGLVGKGQAVAFIEDSWLRSTQRGRIVDDSWNLYQDRLTDPDSHAAGPPIARPGLAVRMGRERHRRAAVAAPRPRAPCARASAEARRAARRRRRGSPLACRCRTRRP